MTGDNREKRFAPLRTQREVADIVGINQSNVAHAEKRAIRKLRQAAEREAQRRGITVRQWIYGE